ncbi:TIGR02588 family protein [Hassallia byssoidea VB512170]|uniref:TIGR02588 family protein n=1 Tax=Hassallia byssoidea VB512170 TaxID=1304833 RepID=A0A846HEX0_9CYAN|nr:TIGR02588 family protein [Hassalia byssoidea]NEU76107.1 TIGR02588 family protein [Hassalia byssoidea VB512170]
MNQTEQRPKRSLAEWVTFSIATLILTVIVGLVCYTWVNDKHEPPIVSVTNKEKIREVNGQFYVPFEIINNGGETAESVQIIAELKINNEVAETGEQQIDFLSSNEKEEGAFVFSTDPRKGQLTLRVASYKSP